MANASGNDCRVSANLLVTDGARWATRGRLRQSAVFAVRMVQGAVSWGGFLGILPVKKFPAASSSELTQRGGLGAYLAWLPVVAIAYFLLAKLGLQLASINPSRSEERRVGHYLTP